MKIILITTVEDFLSQLLKLTIYKKLKNFSLLASFIVNIKTDCNICCIHCQPIYEAELYRRCNLRQKLLCGMYVNNVTQCCFHFWNIQYLIMEMMMMMMMESLTTTNYSVVIDNSHSNYSLDADSCSTHMMTYFGQLTETNTYLK